MHKLGTLAILGALLSAAASPAHGDDLSANFANPPASARPWVYWFPLNGNLSSNGITADLEAMKRVGIGGVLYMETDQGAPAGPARFAGPLWRDLVKHICSEANRLGLEVNMNNDAGWCGSGGPWITPELSMQRVVWTATNVTGPLRFDAILPQPEAKMNFYRDIAVFAFPSPAKSYLIPDIRDKSAQRPGEVPLHAVFAALPSEATIPRNRIIDLTSHLGSDGRLAWDAPAGQWTLLRMGHTTTGVENHPAPEGGLGLESDKLSQEASDAAFAGLMAKVIDDSKPLAGQGRTLVSTHIDSWETGSQNWTPRFREDFKRLRGYDPLPLLPVMTGQVVDNLEVSERFLWDVRMTVNDLLVRNYAGRFRELARQHGLRLSIEAYDGDPADDMTYAGQADEPMAEFWSWKNSAPPIVAPRWPRRPMFTASPSWAPNPSPPMTTKNGRVIQVRLRNWVTGPFAKESTVSSSTATPSSLGPIPTALPACPWDRGDCITSARKPGGNSPRPGTNIWPAASSCSGRGFTWLTSASWNRKTRRKNSSPRSSPATTARAMVLTAAHRKRFSRACPSKTDGSCCPTA